MRALGVELRVVDRQRQAARDLVEQPAVLVGGRRGPPRPSSGRAPRSCARRRSAARAPRCARARAAGRRAPRGLEANDADVGLRQRRVEARLAGERDLGGRDGGRGVDDAAAQRPARPSRRGSSRAAAPRALEPLPVAREHADRGDVGEVPAIRSATSWRTHRSSIERSSTPLTSARKRRAVAREPPTRGGRRAPRRAAARARAPGACARRCRGPGPPSAAARPRRRAAGPRPRSARASRPASRSRVSKPGSTSPWSGCARSAARCPAAARAGRPRAGSAARRAPRRCGPRCARPPR